MKTIYYDGSFEGFLTCLAINSSFNGTEITFLKSNSPQIPIFSEPYFIKNNREKALEIWSKLECKSHKMAKTIYFAFLSDEIGIERILSNFINLILSQKDAKQDNINGYRRYLEALENKVAQEKLRLEKEVRFQRLASGALYTEIRPIYNSTPLITKDLKQRFKDETWILHDTKRHFGIRCYNNRLEYIHEAELDYLDSFKNQESSNSLKPTAIQTKMNSKSASVTSSNASRTIRRINPELRMQTAG